MDESVQTANGDFILRESRVLLAVRLMTILLLGMFFILFFVVIGSLFGPVLGFGSLLLFYIVVTIFSGVFGLAIAALVIWKWRAEYYRVGTNGLTKCNGLLMKKEAKYSFSHVEGITLEQSFFGRIFDYGTIVIYDPSQKSKIFLFNIPRPRGNSVLIEKALLKNRKKGVPIVAQNVEQHVL